MREWGEGARLRIGAYTSIASGVQIFLGGEHRVDWVTTFPFSALWPEARGFTGHPKTKGDVHIGNDVWIGTEALVFSGVTIGDGAVVGARTVVTRDVPPYAVVAGAPARVVKTRFPAPIVASLLAIQWWNWPREKIARALPDLLSPDIARFVEQARLGSYDVRASAE